jgi:hypothetical protein
VLSVSKSETVWIRIGIKLVCSFSYDLTYVKFSISADVSEIHSRDFYTYQLIFGISLKLAICSDSVDKEFFSSIEKFASIIRKCWQFTELFFIGEFVNTVNWNRNFFSQVGLFS